MGKPATDSHTIPLSDIVIKNWFVAYFYCNGRDLNLGISLSLSPFNVEIYIPFGFFRIGIVKGFKDTSNGSRYSYRFLYKAWGYNTNIIRMDEE